MEQTNIHELDNRIDKLQTSVEIMMRDIKKQGEAIEKLIEHSRNLTIYIERTNENDKKITALFKKFDTIYMEGTKHCPVNMQRITEVEHRIERTNKRLDDLNKWLVGALITIALQFLYIIVHVVEKMKL